MISFGALVYLLRLTVSGLRPTSLTSSVRHSQGFGNINMGQKAFCFCSSILVSGILSRPLFFSGVTDLASYLCRGGLGSGSTSINHPWRVMALHMDVLGPIGDEGLRLRWNGG